MSEGVDLIGIYADEEFNQDPEFHNTDQIDLYDDVLTATSQPSDDRSSSAEPSPPILQEPSPKPNNKTPAILYMYSGLRSRRAAVYVGSFFWWTTDQQLIQVIRSIGVYDVVELKFAENQANGQSKGFGVPPPPPGIHYQHLMPPPRLRPHLTVSPPGAIPSALHLNPAFFPPPNATVGPPSETCMKASMPHNHHGSRDLGPPPSTVSEAEFEEIMKRNRAISSSAISKAVSGASAGDYSDAIETLLMAIAVIKQSRVANDERCRVLISSLKDCLHGIEVKSYSVGASSSSSRKRHRSRERSPSQSRESSRWHRDMLHNEDYHDDYFPERSREHERHRDRERNRHH
ncbi:Cleavage and polyadenylation specificity factor subunit 7 [Heterocephalus glaber]|uniref:Cleavage and polyadenylation specificity factor subunit 7 n=1 Tax=Heterocephalus glaber TaxID=10181 RepID=G5AUV3_HETGA|nr:Cleavage and polyadenylation specificity factor subunit 7 [Heterocephalus glaber]